VTTAYQRDAGILKRVRGTPLPAWIYLGGKIVSATIVAAIGVTIMLGAGALFFGLQIYAEAVPALLLTFLIGVGTFAALGLLVAALAPSGPAATAIANATILPSAFVSGVFIVLPEDPPAWLSAVANFFPLKHFVEPFVAAFSPEATRAGFLWADLAYLALWGVVALALAIRFFRWEPSTGEGVQVRGRRARATTS
jgi:ABC-2 type transport system permease protein